MAKLVARQGRELQRYTSDGHRLVVGCIPYRFKADDLTNDGIQVLVISSQKGRDVMFPRGGWESDESAEEAAYREAMEEAGVRGVVEEELGEWWFRTKPGSSRKRGTMFPLSVTEELLLWPEMASRKRRWVTVEEAWETCRQQWMREALEKLLHRLSCFAGGPKPAILGGVSEHAGRELREDSRLPPAEVPGKPGAEVVANQERATSHELCSTAPSTADHAGEDMLSRRLRPELGPICVRFAVALSSKDLVWLWVIVAAGDGVLEVVRIVIRCHAGGGFIYSLVVLVIVASLTM